MSQYASHDLDANRARFWRISSWKVDTGFPERLRDCRLRMGLTQYELASRIGIERSYVNKLEAGVIYLPGPRVVQGAAAVLNVDPIWLRGYEQERAA